MLKATRFAQSSATDQYLEQRVRIHPLEKAHYKKNTLALPAALFISINFKRPEAEHSTGSMS